MQLYDLQICSEVILAAAYLQICSKVIDRAVAEV